MRRSHWAVFVVICGILGFLVLYTIMHVIDTTTSKARALHAPSPVETVPVRRQTLDEVIGGSGAVEQAETVNLITQLTAQVLEVPVKIGDIVKKGALLVQWDDRLIKATVDANREYVEADNIKIRNETRQVERYSTLQNKNMGTAVDLEKYEMSLADAKIDLAKSTVSLKQAEIDLEHVKQLSPIDGIVLERLVNPNEFTKPGQIIMKLGVLNTVLMAAKITEEKMHSVQLGLPAETTFPAFPSEIFKGTVAKIDPNIDPTTRTFTAYIKIENPDFRLKPGLSGFARIQRSAKDVLAVPSIAIMNPSGEQASVFVVDGTNHAKLRKVRPGIVVDAMTEITDGLKEGEKVVTVGQFYLRDDDKVHTTFRSIFK
ncbi:MAG TPA: efflux RND transporter periplasmic adaptor subunit [Candidatus Udaeobacter sp.]|jgi:RND family efflux transporter MFP subunit|nr:efflux RND transporter periplasmic adaptor subunit [Candidatus Udaeobacter sp.]